MILYSLIRIVLIVLLGSHIVWRFIHYILWNGWVPVIFLLFLRRLNEILRVIVERHPDLLINCQRAHPDIHRWIHIIQLTFTLIFEYFQLRSSGIFSGKLKTFRILLFRLSKKLRAFLLLLHLMRLLRIHLDLWRLKILTRTNNKLRMVNYFNRVLYPSIMWDVLHRRWRLMLLNRITSINHMTHVT